MLKRRAVLTAGAFAFSGTILSLIVGCDKTDLLTVEGGQLRWSSTLPGHGWIGGNADQIKSAIASMQKIESNKDLGNMLGYMVTKVGDLDVYLLNSEDHGIKPTQIKATLYNNSTDIKNEQYLSSLAKNLADSEVKSAVAGTKAFVETQKFTTTAGRPAATIVVRVFLKNDDSSVYHLVFHLVRLDESRWHTFRFEVDSRFFVARYNEFNQMLDAIRYSS